jgi:K+ transporter
MTTQIKIDTINKILEKKIYNFHCLDEENMILVGNGKATPDTQYYVRRELIELMNDLFNAQIEYNFNSNEGQIYIK